MTKAPPKHEHESPQIHQQKRANRTVFANEHGMLGSLQLGLERNLRVLLDELEEALVTKHFATYDK